MLTSQALLPVTADEIAIPNTGFATLEGSPRVLTNPVSVTATVSQAALEIVKTGDRAAAEPGDTVLYRLLVRNTGAASVSNLVIQDTLPLGLQLVSNSVQGVLTTGATTTPVSIPPATVSNRVATLTVPVDLTPQSTLTITYAAVVTPDAIRGTGRNLALAAGRTPTQEVRSNSASHLLRIRPGIVSDCGTLVGRVFVDKNFDGIQQPGEPGVPNAVVFMDDGNRIVTDANGLFSVANVVAGYRTGVLDLSSLPGYTLAPNLYRSEANSQSRLVRMAPGSLVRMNFAVTPAFGEERQGN